MLGILLKTPEICRTRTRTQLPKATTISGMCVIGYPTYGTHFRLARHGRHESNHGKKKKQRVEKCLCGMITCIYQRCMTGVEIVVGEISGGEDVVPTTDLGDENAIPRFSSETSLLSELDAVFIGSLPHHCPNSMLVRGFWHHGSSSSGMTIHMFTAYSNVVFEVGIVTAVTCQVKMCAICRG